MNDTMSNINREFITSVETNDLSAVIRSLEAGADVRIDNDAALKLSSKM